MEDLSCDTEDQLDPADPLPVCQLVSDDNMKGNLPAEICLDEWSNEGTDDRTKNGTEDDKRDGVLLLIWIIQIGDHTKGDRSTSRGKTTKTTSNNDCSKVRCESS